MAVGRYHESSQLVAQRSDNKQALAPLNLFAAIKAHFLRTGDRIFHALRSDDHDAWISIFFSLAR